MDDFVPLNAIKNMLQRWWLLLLFMLAGAGVGMLVVEIQKPVYESEASITTSINFAYTERLSEDDLDYLLSAVGDVISSSAVYEEVKSTAAARDLSLTDEDIRANFNLARQAYRWVLTVRHHDPQVAQILCQLWAEASGRGLEALHQKTAAALMLQSAQLALQNCFSQIVVVDPVSSYCSVENLNSIRDAFAQSQVPGPKMSLPATLFISKINTEITDNANLPTSPVVLMRGLAAVAGVFIGLMAGLVFFFLRKTDQG